MITTKQRAKLRSIANTIETIGQIGKGGITETVVKQLDDALTAREIVKMRVLETAPVLAREAATQLAEELGAEIVQVIGMKFVLYRKHPKNPVIVLD